MKQNLKVEIIKPARQRILVGTNTLSEVQQPSYVNHCQFWFRLGRSYPDIDFIFWAPPRMSIDRMRNAAAKAALECDASHILFLDDDVIINPHEGLQMLLDCNADLAAGKVVIRGYPFDYMVFKYGKSGGLNACKALPKKGIYNVDAVGFSFALLKTDMLRQMTPPWFVTGPTNTEDIYYCLKARHLNPKFSIKVNCACDCGHILWPEYMTAQNREHYKEYFEKSNVGVKEEFKHNQLREGRTNPKNPAAFRGGAYLKEVKAGVK